MKLGQVVLKIRAAQTDFLNRVAGTVEFALAQEFSIKEETAFVIPLAEADQGDNQYDTSVNQMVNERFGVVVALKNDVSIVDKLGFGAHDRLWAIRRQLFAALLGWVPPDTEMPVYYKGGQVLDINPAWLWYQFSFQQETHITSSADGVDAEQQAAIVDDFLRAYSQWLVGNVSQAILPMTGTPPVLPESMQPPDMSTIIDFECAFDSGFATGFNTLDSEAAS